MKKRCARCEKGLRVGSARWAFDFTDVGLVRQLVCSRCFWKALPILPPKAATVAPLCTSCKRGLASVCAECAAALAENVRQLIAANVTLRQGGKS